MEKILLDTDYAKVSYIRELKMGKVVWKRKTTIEEYQHAFMTILDYSKNNRVDNFLSDITKQGVVSPETRKWVETVALPGAIDTGLKRLGTIFDGNVFKKYYLNMIIKASNKFGVPFKLFLSEEEAIEWFKSFE